jgi:hypothetical protein
LDKGGLPLLKGHSLFEKRILPLPTRVFFQRPRGIEIHPESFLLVSEEGIDPIEELQKWSEAFGPV